MKKLAIFASLLMVGCTSPDFKYKIEGKTVRTRNSPNGAERVTDTVNAIAYTDTIHGWTDDSVWYYNSNG